MYKVILQPCGSKDSRKHYNDTIKTPVKLGILRSYISKELFNDISTIFYNKDIPIWGVTPGKNQVNIKKWCNINIGDISLFSKKGEIFSSGIVAYKLHSKELALNLWGENSQGDTWEYIYLLDEIKNLNIPYRLFNKVVGYKENNVIQGFTVLDQDKSERILNYFDLTSNRYNPEVSNEEYSQIVKEFDPNAPLDIYGRIKIRKEQSYLRKYLFGNNPTGICGICGKEYPVDLLVTAHIKKRAICTQEEKLDYTNNIMPMCKFGCDDLFEKGYISVIEGKVKKIPNKLLTPQVKQYLDNIEGNPCSYWTDNSKKYFKWHINYHS